MKYITIIRRLFYIEKVFKYFEKIFSCLAKKQTKKHISINKGMIVKINKKSIEYQKIKNLSRLIALILILQVMFVKRINKIYAPTKSSSSFHHRKSKIIDNSSKQNKEEIEQKNLQKRKQEFGQENTKSLKVLAIALDPHGMLFALYSQTQDAIYLVATPTLLHYVTKHRQAFQSSHQYSFAHALKPQLIIPNPRPAHNIFQIKFSHRIENTQMLAVVYYNGIIDLFSVVSGKKIDGIDLGDQSERSPLCNVNFIGHGLFISTYDGNLYSYEGKELSKCSKYSTQWVRLGYHYVQQTNNSKKREKSPKKQQDSSEQSEQETLIDIQIAEQTNRYKKYKKVPIYQSKDNRLFIGDLQQMQLRKKIKTQKQVQQKKCNIDPQQSSVPSPPQQLQPALSESYAQYLQLQLNNLSHLVPHAKHILSICQRYIISRVERTIFAQKKNISHFYYVIRDRGNNWRIINNVRFCWGIAINQFWGTQAQETSELLTQLDFGKYYMKTDEILVVVRGSYSYNKQTKKLNYSPHISNQKNLSIVKIKNTRKQKTKLGPKRQKIIYYGHTVCKLIQAKFNIIDYWWVSPNALLYLDQQQNVYYLEVRPELLMQ